MDLKGRLKKMMPKNGLIYRPQCCITRKRRHDAYIFLAFLRAGLVTEGNRSRDVGNAKQAIDQAMTSSISIASTADVINKLEEDDSEDVIGIIRFFDALKPRLAWAENINDTAFYDFIFFIIEARREWKANPQYPFELEEHCTMARAIDNFLELTGSSRWDRARAEFDFFCHCDNMEEYQVEGVVEDDDDDETTDESMEGEETISMDPLEEVLDHAMKTDEIVSEIIKMEMD
ncbi:hypothetical protein F4810DRAFT_709934 [Camillea tinctor]|nr:hypothetical protein F4810DRAFT_709934 [Camillea tinctor]